MHIHNVDTASHHSLSPEYILNTEKVTSDNTMRHYFICKPEDCCPVQSITSKVSQWHVCLKSLQGMLVALKELNSSLLSLYSVCLVLFAITTCYLFDMSFVSCGVCQHCSSLAIWKNRKQKILSISLDSQQKSLIKSFLDSPESNQFIFYTDLYALCISDICFKHGQLHEWKNIY